MSRSENKVPSTSSKKYGPVKGNSFLPTPDSYKDMLGRACRQCINVDFHADLTPKDVVYLERNGKIVERRCPYCKMNKHIVVDVKLRGKLKLMFGGKK